MNEIFLNQKCPCGSNLEYSQCCGIYIKGDKIPDTAEKLMRSRYSAYVKVEIDYLVNTTHTSKRHLYNPQSIREWSENSQWEKLEVIDTKNGNQNDETGQVEFKAFYSENGIKKMHHELSTFKKENGNWFYCYGKDVKNIVKKTKVGRNDTCPCGSGKKYKKCCGK